MIKSLLFSSLLAFSFGTSLLNDKSPFNASSSVNRENLNEQDVEVFNYLEIGRLENEFDFPYISSDNYVVGGLDIGNYSAYVQVSNYKYLNDNNAGTQNASIIWLVIIISSPDFDALIGYQVPLRGSIVSWISQSDFKRLISFEIEFARYQQTNSFGVSYTYKYYDLTYERIEAVTDSHIFGGSNITDNWDADNNFLNGYNSTVKFDKPKYFSIDNSAYIDAYSHDAYWNGYYSGKSVGYVDGNNDGLLTGYDNGYSVGFNDGVASDFNAYSWLTGIFSAMGGLLSIQLLPNVSIGGILILIMVLTLLPFLIGLLKGGKG